MVVTPVAATPVARYAHDCECCVLLGQDKDADLYYCPREGSLVARYGDDGPDYSSMPAYVVAHLEHGPLTVAHRLAVERDLL